MIRHTKVSAVADGPDTGLVRPSDWNADHEIAYLSRATVAGIDVAQEFRWTITGGAAGAFPLNGVFQVYNTSTHTPDPGDHGVAMICLWNDLSTSTLDGYAGESRVNAQGTGRYTGHNSKLVHIKSGAGVPAANGSTSSAHWCDVAYYQSDGSTANTQAGLYAIAYLATTIVGGDPLLRFSFAGYDRIHSFASTAAAVGDGAIAAPNGGAYFGLSVIVGVSLSVGGGASFGDAIGITKSANSILNLSVVNVNTGTGAAATMAYTTDGGTSYFGQGSNAFSTIPGAAAATFIFTPLKFQIWSGNALAVEFSTSQHADFAATVRPGRYTVAGLPAAGTAGRVAFATNGRKVGEGGGAGTGVPCYDDGTAWRRYSDDTTVAA